MVSLGNKILNDRLEHFVNDVIPSDLFPYLKCLSQEDKEKVRCDESNDGPSRATYTLVERLQKKSYNCNKAFREFVRALRKIGSDHVAILLDPQYAVSLDDESERSDSESFHFRVMAGTAIDVKITANLYDENKRRLTDLEKECVAKFRTSSSEECRRIRRELVEYLPQGATFVHTKTERSVVLVFRLSRVSAIDKLWEMYSDDSFRELLEKLLFSNGTNKELMEQTIELDLTFVTDIYRKVRDELEGIEAKQTFVQDGLSSLTINSDEHEENEAALDWSVFTIPPVHLDSGEGLEFQDLKLRRYQSELAAPALQGSNSIICAPTNSGKTYVALSIARDHLEKRPDGKIVFIVSTVNLVLQQKQRFEIYLSDKYNVMDISGANSGELSLEYALQTNHVVVVTAQMLVNALEDPKSKVSLSGISLLILDECHHTNKDHPYNKIMVQYMTLRLQPNRQQSLPQIVGLTASLGVGKAISELDAQKHILQLCANLDAMQLVTVKENIDELNQFVSTPRQNIYSVKRPKFDLFAHYINQAMQEVEKYVKQSPMATEMPPPDRVHQQYRQWCEALFGKAASLSQRKVVTYAEQLRVYHVSLTVNEQTRMKDALAYLHKYFKNLQEDLLTSVDRKLKLIYQEALTRIVEDVEKLGEEPENPNLQQLKKLILGYHTKESKAKGILFSTTRESTTNLQSWIEECTELNKVLRPQQLVGTGSSEATGGMAKSEQENVISKFREGEINIIIATTVAEEGLDIKDCSYVIRYGMKGNEISTVQARGRIRAKDGQFSVVVSAKSRGAKREELNEFREMLMMGAIAQVQKMDQEEYQKEIRALQKKAARDREVKQQAVSTRRSLFHLDGITFYCRKCQAEACQARDIRVLQNSFHVVITSDFKEKITTRPLGKPKTFDGLTFNEKVHCGKCNEDWGTTVNIDGLPEVYCIKVCSFALQLTEGSETRHMFKKWNKVPFELVKVDDIEDLLNNED